MQESLQSLHDGLLRSSTPATRLPEAPTGASGMNLSTASQRQGVTAQEQEINEETRAPKRLCLAAEYSDRHLQRVLMKELSSLLGCDCAGSLTDLRTAVQ